MKYSMVKQFSNNMIDNMFNFVFKWVDCGKMFVEFLWSFLEIWMAFFMIFYNAFMYVYYLFLFAIDRGTEESTSMFRIRGTYTKASYMPKVTISSTPNPIPAKYGPVKAASSVASTVSSAAKTAASSIPSARTSVPGAGAKKSIFKGPLSAIIDFFKAIPGTLAKPFIIIKDLFMKRTNRAKEQEAEAAAQSRSLIDDYIKEYEKRRR